MRTLGRLYIVSLEPEDENVVQKLVVAARCGADIIQLRSKRMQKDRLVELVNYLRKNIPDNVLLIVNDYPDVAVEAGADGIHGGSSDFGLEDIKIFKTKYNLIVGVSVYDSLKRAELAEKYGADYVAFSSPYPSLSKDKVLTSVEVIKTAADTLKIPVFVIGGITHENADEVMSFSVHGFAVMSYVFMGDTCEKVRRLKDIIEKRYD